MSVINGFDRERDRWSREATELLFPDIARRLFHDVTIDYAWNPLLRIDRLDKQYGVDAIVRSTNRNYAVAIRIRSQKWYVCQDVTIRYESLQTWGKQLEAQKSIARFMFYAWGDTNWPTPVTSFMEWHLIDLQKLLDLWLRQNILPKGSIPNTDFSSTLAPFSLDDLLKYELILRRQLHGQSHISQPPAQNVPEWAQAIQGEIARFGYEQRITNYRLDKLDYEISTKGRRRDLSASESLEIFPVLVPKLALSEETQRNDRHMEPL